MNKIIKMKKILIQDIHEQIQVIIYMKIVKKMLLMEGIECKIYIKGFNCDFYIFIIFINICIK
jgi:hypothetical protein